MPCVSGLGGRPVCLDPGRYQWVGSVASEEGVMRLILLSVKKSGDWKFAGLTLMRTASKKRKNHNLPSSSPSAV